MKSPAQKDNQRGSVFLTTMVCIFLMSLTSGYMYQMSAYNSNFTNRLQQSTQAQILAEAGLNRAISTIRASWSAGSVANNFPLTSLGNGSYDASVSTVSGRTLVSSVGTVNGVQRTVSAEVVAPTTSALNYVFAGGAISAHVIDPGTGQATGTITGDIYAAGPLTLDGPVGGNLLNVTGNVYGASTVSTSSSVTVSGSQNQNWTQTVSFPTVDFSYYQTIATTNGYYYNSDQTFSSGTLPGSPGGGVIYVNGNVTIQGTQNVTACIIATGNITIQKSGSTYPRVTVNEYTNYPALMTQNGSIAFTSTGNGEAYLTATGLVYSGNNFSIDTGNHDAITITGSVLAKGVIDTDGMTAWNNLNVNYVSQSPPGVTSSGSATMTVRSYNT